MAGYLKAIERHRETGIGFQARVEWNAVRNGMPIFTLENDEAAIRDLAGEIITVPGPRAKPKFCSHQPLFQANLRYQIDLALSGAGEGLAPDALMFDCQTAAPSRIAMAVASATVAWKISANGCSIRKRVACRCRMNPSNWRAFDYRENRHSKGYTVENYNESVNRWPNAIPFSEEYRLFQLQYLQTLIQQLIDYAREQVGDALAFNTSVPLTHAPRLVLNVSSSHYTMEADHKPTRERQRMRCSRTTNWRTPSNGRSC